MRTTRKQRKAISETQKLLDQSRKEGLNALDEFKVYLTAQFKPLIEDPENQVKYTGYSSSSPERWYHNGLIEVPGTYYQAILQRMAGPKTTRAILQSFKIESPEHAIDRMCQTNGWVRGRARISPDGIVVNFALQNSEASQYGPDSF